jgi:protocatechuate 3,4-dioxygenase beta subunit
MKKSFYLLSIAFFLMNFCGINAQESDENLPADYKTRHPIYDYSEKELNNTDSIPDFESKPNPLKISGTVFLSDGVTPAKDVILYIDQADENGDYELKKEFKKRYVYHRGWVKTDADGRYTFYTFVPGADRYRKALKSIHLAIKEPNKIEYRVYNFIFDDDPLLKNSCRKRMARHGVDSILKPEKRDSILVATKNIILEPYSPTYANN